MFTLLLEEVSLKWVSGVKTLNYYGVTGEVPYRASERPAYG